MSDFASSAFFDLQEDGVGNWASVVDLEVSILSANSYQFEVDEVVNLQLYATGENLTWSVISGSLPAGLSMNAAGLVTGTPTGTGTSNFTIQAANGSGGSDTGIFTFQIVGQGLGARPTIVSVVDLTLLANASVSRTFKSTGNPAPTWALTSGSLPPGMNFASNGVLSGTPNAIGEFTITLTVTNATGTDSRTYKINVHKVPVIGTIGKILLTLNIDSNVELPVSAYPQVTWGLISGTLPSGVSLTSDGVITGVPESAVTTSAIIAASNQAGLDQAQVVFEVRAGVSGGGVVGGDFLVMWFNLD